jgi:hypothetical protein
MASKRSRSAPASSAKSHCPVMQLHVAVGASWWPEIGCLWMEIRSPRPCLPCQAGGSGLRRPEVDEEQMRLAAFPCASSATGFHHPHPGLVVELRSCNETCAMPAAVEALGKPALHAASAPEILPVWEKSGAQRRNILARGVLTTNEDGPFGKPASQPGRWSTHSVPALPWFQFRVNARCRSPTHRARLRPGHANLVSSPFQTC